MKFEFEVKVPPVTIEEDSVYVVCGKTAIKLNRIHSVEHMNLTGGGVGDWIPDYDWRKDYTEKNEDRRRYALPYDAMVKIAKAWAKKQETRRLISETADEMGRALK